MNVRVGDRVHNFVVNNESTLVRELKEKILATTGIPLSAQCLVYSGRPVDVDDRTLGAYEIHDGSSLQLAATVQGGPCYESGPMSVFVRVASKDHDFVVTGNTSVYELKQKVVAKAAISHSRLVLMFDGFKLVEEHRTLASYGIQNGSTLRVATKFCGGGFAMADPTAGTYKTGYDASAPAWRRISEGLYLESHCTAASCKAFNSHAYYPVRDPSGSAYGTFSLQRYVGAMKCSECGGRAALAKQMGFLRCRWHAVGQRKDQSDAEASGVADEYERVKEGEEDWLWMDVTVSKR